MLHCALESSWLRVAAFIAYILIQIKISTRLHGNEESAASLNYEWKNVDNIHIMLWRGPYSHKVSWLRIAVFMAYLLLVIVCFQVYGVVLDLIFVMSFKKIGD